MMQPVTVYSKSYCPYCSAAAALLTKKGVNFDLFDISADRVRRDEMQTRAPGARTVPQIFIGDHHVGGFDDLNALEQAGELDKLLNP